MKVLLLITDLDFGGAEVQVVKLAKEFKGSGLDVRVISMMKDVAFRAELLQSGILLETLNIKGILSIIASIPNYIRQIRKFKPDVIHSHMYHANIYSRLLKIFYITTPLVSTAHSTNEGGGLRNVFYRITKKIPSLTTNVSKNSIKRFLDMKLVEERTSRYIYNGIYTKNMKSRKIEMPNSVFKWIAVGRLVEDKGYIDLINAVKIIGENFAFRLEIYGQGYQYNQLKRIIGDLNLNDKISLMGINKNIQEVLNEADAFVMSSINEGLPMVLLEASVAGLPIVTTDVGGNCEIVIDKNGGYVVNPASPFELSRAMINVMSASPEERLSMGMHNQSYVVENFDLDQITKKWLSIYGSLVRSEAN